MEKAAVYSLSIGRIVVGAYSWLLPKLASRTLGLDNAAKSNDGEAVTRLFGARDLALGYALPTSDAGSRDAVLKAGLIVDSLDILSGLIASKKGIKSKASALIVGGAASFVGLGAYLLYKK